MLNDSGKVTNEIPVKPTSQHCSIIFDCSTQFRAVQSNRVGKYKLGIETHQFGV